MRPTLLLGAEWLGEHAWEGLSFFEAFVVSAAIHRLYQPRSPACVARAIFWWWRGPWAPPEGSMPRGWEAPRGWWS